MAREIKRLSKKQLAEFERLKKNVKSKVYRTKKNYGVDLSGEIEIPNIHEIKTYEELNEWKDKASSFTNRYNIRYQFKKNKHGVVHTVFEQRQGEKLFKEATRQAEKEKARLAAKPVIVNGKVVGNQLQQSLIMKRPSNPRIGKLEPFDINNFRTRMGIENRIEQLRKRTDSEYFKKQLIEMKDSWILSLLESFNNAADDVADRFMEMNPDDFYEFYFTYEKHMNFNLFYDDGKFSNVNEDMLEAIRGYLDLYDNGQMNPLFDFRMRKG